MKFVARLLSVSAVGALMISSASLPAAPAKPRLGTWGYEEGGMDRTVKPGDDFFRYSNGTWLRDTKIDPDLTSAGGFMTLQLGAEDDVRKIVEAIAANPNATPADRQIGDFYAAWMDEAGIEARGTAPLKPYLARIEAVSTPSELERLFGTPGFASPVHLSISADPSNPTNYAVSVGQGDLGMPNRDYYLQQGAKYDAFRAAYRAYVQHIQELAGLPDAAGRTDRIIALETRLANDYWPQDRRRDTKATYNPMDRAGLKALSPQIDWDAMLDAAGLAKVNTVIVEEKSAVADSSNWLSQVPLSVWKEYLEYRFVSDHATYLPKAFDDARFDFFSKTLNGQPVQRDRWKRGVALVNSALGEAVGRIYIAQHFPPQAEQQMGELISDLRAAYKERIEAAPWMDAATRAQALEKLAAFDPRIGHPIHYVDYSPMQVSRADALANSMAATTFAWDLKLSRLPNPVDRTLWSMNPQTVNAYYSPVMNQITFPAAILQPPFFDPAADPAVNYGAIGAVIGHEMGHGFDDQGRQFDATGHLRDWWTSASADSYTARTKILVQQYNAYEPVPGVKLNGQLTLGENLGDLGGLEAAYAAYRRYVARHGEPKVIDGFTGDQRFFLAFAQVWRGKRRDDYKRQLALVDPHSPEEFRVNGVVRNFDPWYKAFNVKPGDKLYLPPDQRVRIW